MYKLLPLLLFLLPTICLKAQLQYQALDWGKITTEDLAMTVYELDTMAQAVVLADQGYMTVGRNDKGNYEYLLRRHKRIKILAEAALEEHGDVSLFYSHKNKTDRIYGVDAQVITPAGEIISLNKDDFFREEMDDTWSKLAFSFPAVPVGSVLEYRYQYASESVLSPRPWYFRSDLPVRSSYFEFHCLLQITYTYMVQGATFMQTERDTSGRDVLRLGATKMSIDGNGFWLQNGEAVKEEPFMTALDDYYINVRFQASATVDNYGNSRSVYGTWEDTSKELLEDEDLGFNFTKKRKYKKLLEAANATIDATATQEEKLFAVNRFLTKEIRWSGDYGMWTKQTPDEAFAKHQGSVAEIQYAGVALLREYGIKAYPVILSTRSNGAMITSFPFLRQFDYVVVIIEIDNVARLVDFTDPYLSPGLVRTEALNGQGFMLHEENPAWITLGVPTVRDNYAWGGKITTEGHLEGQMRATMHTISGRNDRVSIEEESVYSVTKRIIILNKASKANTFSVRYNPDNKILDLGADIYDLSGKPIRKVRKSEIRDVAAVDGFSIYSEDRITYVELNHSEYPYILEFSYRQRLKGISFAGGPNWYFQDRITSTVTSSTFTTTVPEGLDIQYKMYNLDIVPEVLKTGKKTTYTWAAQNIAAIEFEPYDIPTHRQIPILRISPSKFKIDDYDGSMQSWQDYGAFLQQLWTGRDELPAELKAEVQTLTANAASTKEKIAILYRHLQESKRYVSVQLGIGGWQPFTASYVEEHGYGDCKALSNYMKGMLAEIGVESYPVIISAGGYHPYEVEDDFVDPAFNHAILYVPGEEMWLECTSSTNPPGYLGKWCNDRKVLLVTPEGGQLTRTPKLSTDDNLSREDLQVKLAADGSAVLTYAASMQGIAHEEWRNYQYAYSTTDIEDEIRNKGKLPSLTLGEVKIENDANQPHSAVTFTADANHYATRAGKRLFVPLNLICPRTYVPEEVEDRKYPVVISHGYTEEATITFQLPEGFRAESLPQPQQIETPFGKYATSITAVDGIVTYQRTYQMYDDEQPPEAYAAFREFLLDVAKQDDSKMVLVSE
jgi:transglutaminase-like putative cysteine protease